MTLPHLLFNDLKHSGLRYYLQTKKSQSTFFPCPLRNILINVWANFTLNKLDFFDFDIKLEFQILVYCVKIQETRPVVVLEYLLVIFMLVEFLQQFNAN